MDIYAVSIQKVDFNGFIGDFDIFALLWFCDSYEFHPSVNLENGYRRVSITAKNICLIEFYNWFKIILNNN